MNPCCKSILRAVPLDDSAITLPVVRLLVRKVYGRSRAAPMRIYRNLLEKLENSWNRDAAHKAHGPLTAVTPVTPVTPRESEPATRSSAHPRHFGGGAP
jgi:hypothetical protein